MTWSVDYIVGLLSLFCSVFFFDFTLCGGYFGYWLALMFESLEMICFSFSCSLVRNSLN
jgi:hypothetical protein